MDSLDIKFGKYTLVDKIGDGGMAEVYRARVAGVAGFEKIVALKKIHPSLSSNERFQKNFVNEARICGQLHHHNVVEVYEFDRVGDAFYLAMEFIDGANLEDILDVHKSRRHSALPTKVIVSLMVQVLEGLNYAHNALSLDGKPLNVIHRDLKPSNILIDRSGVVKIVDFGVAKADMNRYVTQEMTAKGTASYMAPEQVLGEKKLTYLVDIFSAGSILYELITGERLFDGDHVFAILKAVATTDAAEIVASLPAHGRIFAPILGKMLARDTSVRAQSAGDLIRELNALGVSDVGPRALERFLQDLEDEIEESQATIIDTSGMSAVTAVADPDRSALYQTGPTRVAFLPDAQSSRTSLSATHLSGAAGFDVPVEEELEDDSPTRQTTAPTARVPTARLAPEGESTGEASPPETTQTSPVDLAKATEKIPAAPPTDERSETHPSRGRRQEGPLDDATRPGTPHYVTHPTEELSPEPPPPGPSSLTLSIPNGDETSGISTAVKVIIALAAAVILGMAFFLTSPEQHQVSVDFSSSLDPIAGVRVQKRDGEAVGVEVWADGRLICTTPCTQGFEFTGDSAEMAIEARRDGYEPVTTRLKLEASHEGRPPQPVKLFMKPLPRKVRLSSDPPGARVLVDGADSGRRTPFEADLPGVGTYIFRLEMDGREAREHVVVVGTDTEELNLELGEVLPTPPKGRR